MGFITMKHFTILGEHFFKHFFPDTKEANPSAAKLSGGVGNVQQKDGRAIGKNWKVC